MALRSSSAFAGSAGAARAGSLAGALVVGFWPAALAGAIALLACSSSSDRPPQLGACVPTHGITCGNPSTAGGGGGPPPSEAGASDSGTEIEGEGGSCTGASEIFGTAASSCVTCVATNCCASATSCPNDPNCVSIAVCVTQTCLADDTSCLPTCEGASPTATATEYTAFQQCLGISCPGCPALAPGDL
jgi:hypothetical protein